MSLGNRLAKSVADNALRFYTRNMEGMRMILRGAFKNVLADFVR